MFLFLDLHSALIAPAGLQVVKKGIQAMELQFPELPVVLEPLRSVTERPGFQAPRTTLRILPARNQSRPFQYFKVLRNRRLADRERPRQVRYRGFPLGKSSQDGSTRRIGQGCECRIKPSGRSCITVRFHNLQVIYKRESACVKII
jgi:hypothetical protein